MKSNLQKYYGRWKKELKKSARHIARWASLCKYSTIRSFSEHRLACEIIFSLTVLRKLQDDFQSTKKMLLKYYKSPKIRDEDLSSIEIECDADNKEMPVLKYKFKGDKSFICHSVIASYYTSENCEETYENARTICNQIIHSYIWTIAYNQGRPLGVAISSDKMIEEFLYVVKITDLINYIEYCRDTFLSSAYKLSVVVSKMQLYEYLHEGESTV